MSEPPYPGDLLLHLASFRLLLAHARRGRQGAFEATARELGIDRSVLRRRIQTLREWLDVAILEGRGTDLRATAAGERLAERAERVLSLTGKLRADVAETRDTIAIACTGTISTELLPGVLAMLERRARPVQLIVRRAGGALCESLVRSGEIDLGVVRADEPPRALASRHLSDDRLWLVLPKSHPLSARARPTLAQIAQVPLVLYGATSRTRARVMTQLGPLGATLRVEVEGRAAALAYARAGVGAAFVSLLPGHRVEGAGVRARDVTALFPRSRFFVIARADRWEQPSVLEVVEHMVRAVARR